jgi:hypothetical protein
MIANISHEPGVSTFTVIAELNSYLTQLAVYCTLSLKSKSRPGVPEPTLGLQFNFAGQKIQVTINIDTVIPLKEKGLWR